MFTHTRARISQDHDTTLVKTVHTTPGVMNAEVLASADRETKDDTARMIISTSPPCFDVWTMSLQLTSVYEVYLGSPASFKFSSQLQVNQNTVEPFPSFSLKFKNQVAAPVVASIATTTCVQSTPVGSARLALLGDK